MNNKPFTREEAVDRLRKAEGAGTVITEPSSDQEVQVYREAANRIIADRLLTARNRSGLNNDKINRRMHAMYMERRREAKTWTFTNILSPRNMTLPDGEEVTMLSQILGIAEAPLEIHLRTMPWLKHRPSKKKARKDRAPRKTASAGTDRPAPDRTAAAPISRDMSPRTDDGWIIDERYSTGDYQDHGDLDAPQDHNEDRQMGTRQNSSSAGAGELKISHDGDNLIVSGKIWCDKETAAKLRMIVPMRLINQERGDDPWCYEIRGQVHAYQLYNIMHVLYKAPQVLEVDI